MTHGEYPSPQLAAQNPELIKAYNEPRAEGALEAAARELATIGGLFVDDVLAIMRRYGLRGPNVRHVEEQPPTDWEDCCPNAGTRHCDCWERNTQEERP